MAVQQRIIGGGLLIAGIAVVLILIFLFHNKGVPWDEAYATFKKDIYPRYVKADKAEDYLEIERIAKEAKALEANTAMAAVMQECRADAAKGGDAAAQGLLKLLEPVDTEGHDTFDQNVKGLFGLGDGWYDRNAHRVLRQLEGFLGDGLPGLLDVRRTGKALGEVLDSLRLGSGLELPLPASDPSISAPVAVADGAVFRAFGIRPEDIAKALKAQGEGAKAKSARLVWNQSDATATRTRLAEGLAKVPTLAEQIDRAATALGKAERDLKGQPEATAAAARYVKAATSQLATVLEGPTRETFEANTSIGAIAEALRQEASILKAHAHNAPALGQALKGAFAQ